MERRGSLKALILAGGKGTRLRGVVDDLPKPMAPVGGRPFLEHLVEQLIRWEVREVVLATGYRGEVIASHFGDGSRWGVRLRVSQEASPQGTGGAVRDALPLLGREPFLLLNGDSFADADLAGLSALQASRPGSTALALVRLPDTGRYGRVTVDGEGRVLEFSEKRAGGPGLINGGVLALDPASLPPLPPGELSFEREVLPRLVEKGAWGLVGEGFFVDIGVPEDYLAVRDRPQLLRPRRAPGGGG